MNRTLVILLFLIIAGNIQGQLIKDKLDVVGGISAREFVHGGLRYQYAENAQLGLYYGGDLSIYNYILKSISVEHMFHFGAQWQYTQRPVWYIRTGYTFNRYEYSENNILNKNLLILSGGRDFPFTKSFGMNIDLGILFRFRIYQVKPKHEQPLSTIWESKPAARLQFYFSF